MSALDLARRAFWSEHPLCRLYMTTHGVASFSLRQLIAFAETLPEPVLQRLAGD